ncbi:MAG: hypothetical protein LBQ15_13395, partial [Clostridium sp.]|nr:hypothetical protein [Clostridium sp.]
EDKFERRSLSNTDLMSAKADKEDKFERRSLSNTELMSAKADKEDKALCYAQSLQTLKGAWL